MAATKPINFGYRKNQRLRVRVFLRDNFTCRICGWRPGSPPDDYDGRYTVGTWPYETEERLLHVDHLVPRVRGGSSEESNLQTLCESCNCRKAGT